MRELRHWEIEDGQVDKLIKINSHEPEAFEAFLGLETYLKEKEGSLWTFSESLHTRHVLRGLSWPTTTGFFSGPEGPGLQHFAERRWERLGAVVKASEGQQWTEAKSKEVRDYITTARAILKEHIDDDRRHEELRRSRRLAALLCLILFAIPSGYLSYIHPPSWIGALLAGWLAFGVMFALETHGENLGFWIEHMNKDIARLVDGLERQSESSQQEPSGDSD
jgi:hypothetical protein